MPEPIVTIVVSQRERFSCTQASLESLYSNTTVPFKLVYVDGGSPPGIGDWLGHQAAIRGFAVVRRDHYLTPNESRNIGLARVETPFVVFVDNDVLFFPGWVEKMLDTALATGAWLVGPTYLEGPAERRLVHMAGGEALIVETNGQRRRTSRIASSNRRWTQSRTSCRRDPPD